MPCPMMPALPAPCHDALYACMTHHLLGWVPHVSASALGEPLVPTVSPADGGKEAEERRREQEAIVARERQK